VIAITGSGEIAISVARNLLQIGHEICVYGRQHTIAPEIETHYRKLDQYRFINFDSRANTLLVTNGSFIFNQFEKLKTSEIDQLIESNFGVVANIVQRFLQQTVSDIRRDVIVLGSTAAYDLGPLASVYGASKLALKGLLTSLNKEYAKTDTRFSYISFSTVDNSMGKLVPDQIQETLLALGELSKEITLRVTSDTKYFEPETILRRRFIQEHKSK
jgi:NADP-dependent 3-hydroxy acid dehydrogenase YdfG